MDNTVASVVLEATQSMDEFVDLEVDTVDAAEANGRIDRLCISKDVDSRSSNGNVLSS
ncbi:hypothetical protein Pmar_PMAR023538 [Perkinsus marinus ATCC 50983]|uniref:Uncharacterized protein n=1 Tax=Perkinsus marinus (strain ATCC 50983 / TXsc) TaxID=423536 RepID=C5KCM2_PERM5|nr:hypothetical protein Pmar_PMAR023538 [Perkinsus marinus ATCC 50983]EER17621.1 hypothetical protein Pmar_PMAR023538 [Perkinsus marinus ATCC 50983]|eukprot:XP_002785825.1 hypothetical protein Pmar_PMAR023538 [Perkinsus marinus ATCC 50983]